MSTDPTLTRAWLPSRLARVDDLARLKPGWADSGSLAPTTAAVDVTRSLVHLLSAYVTLNPGHAPQLVPTVEGGIQIEWHEGGHDLEVEIHPDGHIEGWLSHRSDRADVGWGPKWDAEHARPAAEPTEEP